MKSVAIIMLTSCSVVLFSLSAQAAPHSSGDNEDYAIGYCRYYKTKAMFAGRKARANRGVAKYRRVAYAHWAQYNACLKDNGWPTAYRPPVY